MSDPASQGRSSPPALSLQGITGVPPGATARAPGRTNGLTNGMTNGIGRTNGLSRPRGRTNGLVAPKGRTNGLVNGHGFINGLPLRRSRFGVVASSDYRRAGAFLATSFLLMILFSYLLGVPGPAPSRFAMDGNFSDWATIPKYVDGVDNSLPAHVDLLDFAVVREDWRVFVYGRTRGPLFPGGATSSVYVLVDNPNTTGYSFHGLDVDYLAEAWGWGGQLRETSLRAWGGGPDRDNATSFSTVGGFDAASSGSEFELMLTDAELDLTAAPALKLTVVTRSDDAVDVSVSVALSPGALSVDQRPLTEVVASNSTVIELTLTAYVADVDIRGLVFDHTGGGTVVIPNPQFRLSAGAARTEGIGIDVTGVPTGSLIGLRLRDVDAFIAGTNVRVPVTVTGPGARLYAQSIPAGHVIDGVFADWTAPSVDPNDAVPASVDILEYGFNVSSDAFFYVGTRGDVLAGAILPERRSIPPPPTASNGTGVIALPRRAAEDLLRIYVDTDDQDPVGYSVAGISANRLIEARGRNGRVTSTALYAWNGTTWGWDARPGSVAIEDVGGRLEASAPAAFFGTFRSAQVVFALTDWSLRGDLTDVPTRTRGASLDPGPSPYHAGNPDEVKPTPLDNTPTIDGNCNSFAGEYSGGKDAGNSVMNFTIGLRGDTKFLYVCIRVTADTTRSNNDWGEVIFDTLHNGGTAPQTDDRLFWLNGNGDTTVTAWQGTGSGWGSSCPACDPGNLGTSRYSTYEWYEFKIRYTDVWGTLTPSANQTAGFAIAAYDFNTGNVRTWGGEAVDEKVPNTWGHVFFFVPEFPTLFLAVVPFVLVSLLRRRVRRPT